MSGGPGRLGGCPLCGPQLVVSPCVSEREERFVTVAGQMKPGSLFFFFSYPKHRRSTSAVSFPRRARPHPFSILPHSQESLPWG